jgi:hypothetical protein
MTPDAIASNLEYLANRLRNGCGNADCQVKEGRAVSEISKLITDYLMVGGLFNPEIMHQTQHDAVRNTLIGARDEILEMEQRIKRLEEAVRLALSDCHNGPMQQYVRDKLIKAMEYKP